jgi:carbon storage regulator
MLVLSRKEGQRVMIGDSIVVIVNRIAGNRISLGIEAPPSVRVMRGELEPAPVEQETSEGLVLMDVEGEGTFDSIEIDLPGPLAHRMRGVISTK